MLRYESLILTVPEITEDEIKGLEKDVDRLVQAGKGSTVSFERWGKFRLAYPVRKNDYGVYFLARFETPKDATVVKEIRTFFAVKLNDLVMRHMTSALDEKKTLAYQRPKSLEETPARDVSTFLKENKMEGLLSTVEDKPAQAAPQATTEPAPQTEETKEVEQAEPSSETSDA